MFLRILIFNQIWLFWKGYSLWIVPSFGDFGKVVIFRILGVFWSRFFTQKKSNVVLELFFACFLVKKNKKLLRQSMALITLTPVLNK